MPPTLRICDLSAALIRMGNRVELLKKIIEFFREDSVGIFHKLQQAVEQRDRQAVQQAAHSLRGLIANFNAEAAGQPALELELMGKNGDLSNAQAKVRELEQELTRLDATLTTEMAKIDVTPARTDG